MTDPRQTDLWHDAVIKARTTLEDRIPGLPKGTADRAAEAIADVLLTDFLTIAEGGSEVVFGMDGTGPFCSWCGKLPGPRLHPGHSQYGLFCSCRRAAAQAPTTGPDRDVQPRLQETIATAGAAK